MPDTSHPTAVPSAEFRYGAVFFLTLTVVVFLILTPVADWSRAVAFALQSAALLVVVATSRARPDVRRARVFVGVIAASAWVLAIATGLLPLWLVLASSGVVSIAIPLALIGGLVRLVRHQGATLQAVAGSLAIYLLLGLTYAWVIGFVSRVDPTPYFSSGTDGTQSERLYFSFTVLTTTGFGDLTAGSALGRALAVLEMLTGQLYLVTVIGVLVGSFGRR